MDIGDLLTKAKKGISRRMNYYTLDDYSKKCQVPRSFIDKMVKKKKLPIEKKNGKNLVPKMVGDDLVKKMQRLYEKDIGTKVPRFRKEKEDSVSFFSTGKSGGNKLELR